MKLTKQTTIEEVLQTDTFKGFLQTQLDIYKMYGANIDARAKTLRELVETPWYNVAGITEQYALCLDKTCKMSKHQRDIIKIMSNNDINKNVKKIHKETETEITYSNE